MNHSQRTAPSQNTPPTQATPAQPKTSPARITGLILLAILAVGIVGFSLTLYGRASLTDLAEANAGLAKHYATMPAAIQLVLYIHIATASLALLLGIPQFIRPLRKRVPRVHRYTGRVYAVSVLFGATSGLALATVSAAGIVGLFGFGTLSALWAWTLLRAWGAIHRGDLASHEAWMIRNYALTFAAPTLRLWLPLLILAQFAFGATDAPAMFANAYAAVPFLCWIPNLIFAEWLVRRRGLPAYRLAA